MFGWFKKSPPKVAERANRYLLLFSEAQRVFAADVTYLIKSDKFPAILEIGSKRYYQIVDEDMWVFWDELRDEMNRTVGYIFNTPDSPIFASTRLWTESENVVIDNAEVHVLLYDCAKPRFESIQGFGSEMYQSHSESRDCILLMMDYSQTPEAFEAKIIERIRAVETPT